LFLKSARRRRAIEVAGPRSFWERGQRTQGGQSITAWRGCQRTGRESPFCKCFGRQSTEKSECVVYARVSSSDQKADLDRQIAFEDKVF
ncbi:hypothetical protein QUF54_01720, partial [Candidatus Marithioploca araucensis]|nr:hypothetical protein [Candidatus Marithioploca araucensis]